MSKIIVGVDESPGSADAIALASSLAGMTGAKLMLVNVFPYDVHPSRAFNYEYETYMRQDSVELLERLRSAQGDETIEIEAIPNPSSAHGLHALAEKEDAGLIVVGSTHTGRAGRVAPGSTAERLLHGSPCPVAVAPKNYAHETVREPGIVGVGYDGSASAQHALATAHRIASATGA
jgi:nucleotide-binding universal stress UspA family protein